MSTSTHLQEVSNESTIPLMTTEEVSHYLKVPVGTLYKWRREGTGPRSFRVGRGTRYRQSDVESWIEGRS
ncbi:MAG: helix-turn-helix domain-containing protein [Solirubrobacterales bacterium]|nr:helix-turn-helix domain-containing protein [Solirubrobacterales bacterium]